MVPRDPLEHPSNGVTPNAATAGTWGPGSPHDPSGIALALRESSGFQMKENVSNVLKIRALAPALPSLVTAPCPGSAGPAGLGLPGE